MATKRGRPTNKNGERSPIIQSVERAAVLLGLFSADTPRLTLSEMANGLGLGKATTHRYAVSLRTTGLLQFDPVANVYTVGPRAIALAGAALSGVSFMSVAETHMRRLSDAIGETVALSVWDGDAPVVVHVIRDVHKPVQFAVRVGIRLTEGMAQHKVFRAFRAQLGDESDAQTKVDPELALIRSSGVAFVKSTSWWGMAVPVFDGKTIIASLGVMGVGPDLPDVPDSPIATQIRTTADELSQEITASLGQLRVP